MGLENWKSYKKFIPYLFVLMLGILLGGIFSNKNLPEPKGLNSSDINPDANYTCSMHPEVNLVKKGQCPICGMDLILNDHKFKLESGQFQMEEGAMALANISTLRIQKEQAPSLTIRLSGVLTANEKTNSLQTTLFNGRLEKLHVNAVGDQVRKGQEIGQIYSPDMYLAQDKLLTAASYKDTHEKLYEASRYGLGLWKLTDKQVEEVLRSKEPIFNFPLTADVSGTVIEILAKVGDYYREGDPLFILSDLSTLWAVFDAYENQLQYLSVGQKVQVDTQAYPGRSIEANINFIEPVIDPVRRTAAVRVVLNNREGKLKLGMFAQALTQVEIEARSESVWIPKSAVLWTGIRSLVYLKHPGTSPIFESREITLGHSANDSYEVLAGLQPGDEVVINGTFTVDAAAQLARKRSMMRPESIPADPETEF